MRFVCPECEAAFLSAPARPPPARVPCAGCGAPMEPEADVLELRDRATTRPYDLNALKAQLEEEQRAASTQNQVWFVGVSGHSVGPLTATGLEGLQARGHLQRDSLVWREGWPVWTRADAVPEMRAILGLPAATSGEPPTLPRT